MDGEAVRRDRFLECDRIACLVIICVLDNELLTRAETIMLDTKGHNAFRMPHKHRFHRMIKIRVEGKLYSLIRWGCSQRSSRVGNGSLSAATQAFG